MKIQVLIKNNDLSTNTKEEMWSIYQKYYHYSREAFMNRIHRNNYYSFYYHQDKIVGFTGLKIDKLAFNGEKQLMIYFGQTIIEREFRGKSLIPVTAAKLCIKFLRSLMTSKVYFWYDALTYKAYLVAAKTVSEYYPSRTNKMTKEVKQLMDYIGEKHYGDKYDACSGTVMKDTQLVNDASVNIQLKDYGDEDINFYMQANPNHHVGHGLLTFAPASLKTVGTLLKRYIYKSLGIQQGRACKTKTLPKTTSPVYPRSAVQKIATPR